QTEDRHGDHIFRPEPVGTKEVVVIGQNSRLLFALALAPELPEIIALRLALTDQSRSDLLVWTGDISLLFRFDSRLSLARFPLTLSDRRRRLSLRFAGRARLCPCSGSADQDDAEHRR